MLAKLSAALPPDDENWAFEMKWDGIRAIVAVAGGDIRVCSRNRIDRTADYPELLGLADQLGGRSALLDGEIVAFDESGKVTFEAWQRRGGYEGERRVKPDARVPIALAIFDVMELDGRSLIGLAYTERRERLLELGLQGDHWMTPPHSVAGGEQMLATSREQGMEGVVAKRLDSCYEPGRRTGAWTKVKNHMRQEFVIGGWVPGEGRRSGRIGALVIGYYDGGRLVCAGSVGTGFTNRMLDELGRLLEPLAIERSSFEAGPVPRATHFVRPELVCEVEFTEWT
ncbi:MAG: non-homologous end-joining DNA ligase, partial [Chloroflexi bacterium]|nr:non-homologous end-joining DNA ligase [Chloroflexota bacterium]